MHVCARMYVRARTRTRVRASDASPRTGVSVLLSLSLCVCVYDTVQVGDSEGHDLCHTPLSPFSPATRGPHALRLTPTRSTLNSQPKPNP